MTHITRRDAIRTTSLLLAGSAFATAALGCEAEPVATNAKARTDGGQPVARPTGQDANQAEGKAADAGAKKNRPNVLLISVDDLRPELNCYGRTHIKSPHIDALAAHGTVFQRAYCNVPVCGPSRVGMLTGRRTSSNQWWSKNLKGAFVSLPALLKQSGYTCVSNGKTFHHMHDRAEDWSRPPWRCKEIYHGKHDWAGYNHYGQWQNPESAKKISRKKRGPYCESADVADNAYPDGQVADKTIANLKTLAKAGKPFFMACGFWRPHLPFNAPKKYWDLYKREEIKLATNRFRPKNAPGTLRSSTEIDGYFGTGSLKKKDQFHREARHAYAACVSYVDAQIGRVMKALEELKLADDTIVVLWGDHGWNLGEHTFWGKHNTTHNSLHAPLIVVAPGQKSKNKTRALVEFVDIYPTLCELTKTPLPGHLEGSSFAPLLSKPDLPWKTAVFVNWSGCKAVKTDRYLYTEWNKRGPKPPAAMLYDHKTDPDENVNIAGKAESKSIVAAHKKLLAGGWKAVRPKR